MSHDPNLPDFDAMSQDEWFEWLKDAETLQQETPPKGELPLQPEQQLNEDDTDETPTALTPLDDSGSDESTDPLTWIADRATEEESEGSASSAEGGDQSEVADFLDEMQSDAELEDPLEWLASLPDEVNEVAEAYAASGDGARLEADIDDDYEDIATDEDESLYSQGVGEWLPFPESLIGLGLPIDDIFNTQSLAPVPDFLVPAAEAPESDQQLLLEDESGDRVDRAASTQPAPSQPAAFDSLTHAFLMRDHQAELEAWYTERLRTVAAAADTANQQAGAAAPDTESLKPPPPGLAAGFNTARGKIAEGKLEEALGDYETLLRANIGLDLVVSDMQWLLQQTQHRDNLAVHRVLGDALMRQDQLQQALAVYRHALKLL